MEAFLKFDAGVLLDEEMPAMDGHTALRLLRATDPAVRVVCMSGGAPAEDPGGAGTVRLRFLLKPFRFRDLLEQVRGLVGRQPG